MGDLKSKDIFATNLTSLRKSKQLSQEQFASEIGVSRGVIGNYEQGSRRPDFELLCTISDYFDVSTDYLLGRSTVPTPNQSAIPPTLSAYSEDKQEVLKLYSALNDRNQGAWMERGRLILEEQNKKEVQTKKTGNSKIVSG